MPTLSATHPGQDATLQPRAAPGAHIPPRGQQDVLSREPCSPVGMELLCSSWMLPRCCHVLEQLQFKVGAAGPPHCHGDSRGRAALSNRTTSSHQHLAPSPALVWWDMGTALLVGPSFPSQMKGLMESVLHVT